VLKDFLFSKKAVAVCALLCTILLVYSCTKDKLTPPVSTNTEVSFKNDIYSVFKSASVDCGNGSCHYDEYSLPWFTNVDSCYTSLLRDTSINIEYAVKFVNTEHPDSSFLYQKLAFSHQIYGERMPLGGPYLSEQFTAKVLDWIKQGAHNN
jgi:hypothetical protein